MAAEIKGRHGTLANISRMSGIKYHKSIAFLLQSPMHILKERGNIQNVKNSCHHSEECDITFKIASTKYVNRFLLATLR